MHLEVDYTVHGSILAVRISGYVEDFNEYKEYFAGLQAKLEETGCDRILVDSREARFNINTLEVYRIASADAIARRGNPPKRFAILTVPEERADAAFYENVAANRGFKVKFFLDEDQAWEYVRS